MDIPSSLYEATVAEGKLYFFKTNCPIGIKDHIHVCIKRGDAIFFFATCSSQIEKAIARARVLNYDINTYPIFTADETNRFTKPQTFVDCNHPIEVSYDDFCNLLNDDKVYELPGHLDELSLNLIIKGIGCSTVVENRIKEIFTANIQK